MLQGVCYNYIFMNRVKYYLLIVCTIFICWSTNKNLKASDPILLNGVHDRIITGLEIINSKTNCIDLRECYNIKIQNCRFISSKGEGVFLYNCKNITITNCYMENVSTGVLAVACQGINVSYNQVKNVQGPFPRGQMVQFDSVSGRNNMVSYNRSENILGASDAEDAISMFKTTGTATSPVKIIGNWIRGGGPSHTGGGIMLGDNGGAYLIAENNILVNPGQYGMAISGGTNISIINNTIYSKRQKFTNVGLYIWNQSNPKCALNIIIGNQINWTNAQGERNDKWNNGNCGPVSGWDSNISKGSIDSTILPLKIITKQ